MRPDIDDIINLMNRYTKTDSTEQKGEFGEQESGGGTTSSGGGTKAPYPTVTKWSSGRKFGPTYNPEQKIWASGVARGKANTLL